MRSFLAALAVVIVASLGALILGEYELAGFTPLIGGVLFGLVLAELAVSVRGKGATTMATTALTVMVGAAAAGAMVWAAWISSGRDWAFVPNEAWAGVVLAGAAAAAWVRGSRRRATGNPGSPR